MEPADDGGWDLVITARRGWWDLRLREVWESRELIWMFVQRDFVATYKQTLLGPLWHLLQPLLTTLTFAFVFGGLAGLPTEGAPPMLFYMAGVIVWTYFAACLTGSSATFLANAGIFGKVYFPRLAVPLALMLSRLVTCSIQFGLFLVFAAGYALTGMPLHVGSELLLLPALLLIAAALGLGAGLLVSAATVRYRDLQQLLGFGVQLLMYATPVIYPLSFVPADYRPLILLNPLASVFETFRWALLGAGTFDGPGLAWSAAASAAVLVGGLVVFNRVEQTFVDTV